MKRFGFGLLVAGLIAVAAVLTPAPAMADRGGGFGGGGFSGGGASGSW